jgi:hypothetical protein
MLHRRNSDKNIIRSVFDFGMNDSAFMVLAGDSLVFYKYFDHCGNALIESIATHTGVTTSQALRMLEEQHGKSNEDINKAVRDATRGTHESIATDAMKCLRHYGVTNRGPLSSQILITGSAGWNENLAYILSTACNQDVVRDSDSQHLCSLPESITQIEGWHIALGASLSILHSTKGRRGSDGLVKEAA